MPPSLPLLSVATSNGGVTPSSDTKGAPATAGGEQASVAVPEAVAGSGPVDQNYAASLLKGLEAEGVPVQGLGMSGVAAFKKSCNVWPSGAGKGKAMREGLVAAGVAKSSL